MNLRKFALSAIAVTALAGIPTSVTGQGFPAAFMELKERFQNAEDEGIAEMFVGVHTSDGVCEGLYPLRSTGVSTAPVREAADAFLEALTPTQLMRHSLP